MKSKRKYTWVFAHRDTHAPITTWQAFKNIRHSWGVGLGLFCNGVAVGSGSLEMCSAKHKYVQTDATRLFRGFRSKGHGIELYTALVETARALGAKRIYASKNLNKYSTRMWATKLDRRYTVVHMQAVCKHPCRHCPRGAPRHYIQL